MTAADHLAGALSLELNSPVTWTQHPGAEVAVFACLGRRALVGSLELDNPSPQARRNLLRRVRGELDPTQ